MICNPQFILFTSNNYFIIILILNYSIPIDTKPKLHGKTDITKGNFIIPMKDKIRTKYNIQSPENITT